MATAASTLVGEDVRGYWEVTSTVTLSNDYVVNVSEDVDFSASCGQIYNVQIQGTDLDAYDVHLDATNSDLTNSVVAFAARHTVNGAAVAANTDLSAVAVHVRMRAKRLNS